MMFVVGRLSARVQPKYLIVIGAVFTALSMYGLTNVYGDLSFWFFARSRMLLGVGLPLLFLPTLTASYDGVTSGKTDQASALLNAAQYRRLDRHLTRQQCAVGPRAVPSEHARRPGDPVERPISGYAASDDELFLRAGQLAVGRQAPGHPMDRTAGAGAGVIPRLRGYLLDTDGDLARGCAAGAGLRKSKLDGAAAMGH
jgi:hypothetical protein